MALGGGGAGGGRLIRGKGRKPGSLAEEERTGRGCERQAETRPGRGWEQHLAALSAPLSGCCKPGYGWTSMQQDAELMC